MTLRNLPYVLEACDVDGNAIGSTNGTVQTIYMPKEDISASLLLILVQESLVVSGDPSVDDDLFDFAYGHSTTCLITVRGDSGMQIPLNILNQKFGNGDVIGHIKAPIGKRIILAFLP